MNRHPDLHPAVAEWSEDQTLHVAACYSNPFRWRTRRELANDFRRHMVTTSNVELHFIELAYGDRPFEVTGDHPNDIQLRTSSELFHKENLLNLAIRSFPKGWKYGATIDADFHFNRHDWALEAVHQLQHHAFVQLFSQYADMGGEALGKGYRHIATNDSFAFTYVTNGYRLPTGFDGGGWKKAPTSGDYAPGPRAKGAPAWVPVGATGGAWAFTRAAFDTVGGLLDRCILGHADWFMSFGLVGEEARHMRFTKYTQPYQAYIEAWQRRAALLRKNIGYVDGFATHGFHGPKGKRGYSSRDEILVKNAYDPIADVLPDWQGVLQLTSEKPRLRDEIRSYFLSRSEDLSQ